MPIPQPLRDILRRYCNVEAPEARCALGAMLARPGSARRAALFREQLERAMRDPDLTPPPYEALTGEAFDSPQAVHAWLQQLWNELYRGGH
jgi:hypothetical protein